MTFYDITLKVGLVLALTKTMWAVPVIAGINLVALADNLTTPRLDNKKWKRIGNIIWCIIVGCLVAYFYYSLIQLGIYLESRGIE